MVNDFILEMFYSAALSPESRLCLVFRAVVGQRLLC